MKMLFYSSDSSEVDRVRKQFLDAGVPCEVRKGPTHNGHSQQAVQVELWIQDDRDCHRALMLCVHLGVGFAKRAPRSPLFDDEDWELPLEDLLEAEGYKSEKPNVRLVKPGPR